MKILHFLYDHVYNPWVGGGAAVRAYEIYKRLAGKGDKITIISGNYPGCKDYTEGNLQYKFVGFNKNYIISIFSYAYFANNFLNKIFKEFDIIIEDFAPWNPVFSYKVDENKPVILQLHHREAFNIIKRYSFFGIPFFFIEKYYPKKFKNKIVISPQTAKKFFLKNYKIISNGIDSSLLRFNTNHEGDYIFYLGRIDFYNKGLDTLIEAIKKYPLIIVGKGKDVRRLEKLIKEKKNIKLHSFANEKNKINFILNSKFMIMPSRFEGQGIVALEAAALGKPLIVSDIPELKYVINNGFGISFKCGDANDLGEKIKFLWNRPDLIIEMGKKGREFAKNFTWDKIAEQYENYLLEVIRNFNR